MTRQAASTVASDRAVDVFSAEVREHLLRTPRQLPSKYFYDELGSSLFEAICRLPWYHITRAESALLARHAVEIVEPLRTPLNFVELGCGSGHKLALLTSHSGAVVPQLQLIDVSQTALDMASYRLKADGFESVICHRATYEEGLRRAAAARPTDGALVVLFLGSNLGNFDPPIANDLLVDIRRQLRPGDALLLGTDLVKPERDLLLAYDDPLHVTAAFNRNLLQRINDSLDATFDLSGFVHRAVWRPTERRVEMQLVSSRRQSVHIGAADLEVVFEPDEWIWTESSYKYDPDWVLRDGLAAGFSVGQQWIDQKTRFALTRLTLA